MSPGYVLGKEATLRYIKRMIHYFIIFSLFIAESTVVQGSVRSPCSQKVLGLNLLADCAFMGFLWVR